MRQSILEAAYHSKLQNVNSPLSISALLPLFSDQPKSVPMVRHAVATVKLAVKKLNPDQLFVIAINQPIFAVAKQILTRNGQTLMEKNTS